MTPDFPQRLAFSDAVERLASIARAGRLGDESVPVSTGLGRVLAEDLRAPIPLPGFDNSAMDGFALRAADCAEGAVAGLHLVGEQFAGLRQDLVVGPGQCARITTGAPLPEGADCIAIREECREEDGRIFVPEAVRRGSHVRLAGEDVEVGDLVLRRGEVLTPARLSLAAALGRQELTVARRPTVALFTSGDELVPPGQPLRPGEIHDSNRVLLQALLQAEGIESVAWPILPDDPGRMLASLRDAAFAFDVVITCGGVSAGEKDYLPRLVAEHGEVHFWKVMMKPGMPVLAGRMGRCQLLALPGNPVSVLATFLTLGRTLLDGLQGRSEARPRWRARLSAPVSKGHSRLEFLRGRLQADESGRLQVTPNGAIGSHRLRAAADSDALIVLPERAGEYPLGDLVWVIPYAAPGMPG